MRYPDHNAPLWRLVLPPLLALLAPLAAAAPGPDAAETLVVKSTPASAEGKAVYDRVCANCHEAGVPRAPSRGMLQFMATGAIYHALTEGVMAAQVGQLSDREKRAVAEYLTGHSLAEEQGQNTFVQCTGDAARFDVNDPPRVSGWGVTPDNRREFSTELAGIHRGNVGQLRVKWAFGFPGAVRARSHPVVAAGAVHVGSQDGRVYALDRDSGCVRWTFRARSEVRTAIVMSPWEKGDGTAKPRLYFGDYLGNVYALDARSGELVWQQRPDAHSNATITGAPALHDGRLYVPVSSLEVISAVKPEYRCCTFRGSVVAYDAESGAQLWKTYTIPGEPTIQGKNAVGADRLGPSGAPIWNSPAIDVKRNQLYVGTGENYSSPANDTSDAIIAMDLASGRINWVFQATAGDAWNSACEVEDDTNCPAEKGPDYDFGAATILARASSGEEFVLGGQKSGMVWALDPDSGKLRWRQQVSEGGLVGGVHFGMAVSGDRVFVPISDAMLSTLHKPREPNPGVFALDLRSGEYLWKWHAVDDVCNGRALCMPGNGAAITTTPELVFAGSIDGYIRAHDAATGEVLWAFDTAREFVTPSGTTARGGAMEGAASAVLQDGMLFLNSGYLFNPNMPGNLFLAFTLEPPAD